MPYALIAAAILGATLGSSITYELRQATINAKNIEILQLRTAIEKSNTFGLLAMEKAINEKASAEYQAELKNSEMDKGYEQQINTINAYYDELRRLRQQTASNPTHHKNPMPKGDCPRILETTSSNFTEANEADAYKLEAYAHGCRDFVINNCGVR